MNLRNRVKRLETTDGMGEREVFFNHLADFLRPDCPDVTGEEIAAGYPVSVQDIDGLLLYMHAQAEGAAEHDAGVDCSSGQRRRPLS